MIRLGKAFEKSWKYLLVSTIMFMIIPYYDYLFWTRYREVLFVLPIIFFVAFIEKYVRTYKEK